LIGAEHLLVQPWFNALVRPRVFSEDMARAWLLHNVEEVGNFEFFLPELYEAALAASHEPVTDPRVPWLEVSQPSMLE
jgi:hypothetical protein